VVVHKITISAFFVRTYAVDFCHMWSNLYNLRDILYDIKYPALKLTSQFIP